MAFDSYADSIEDNLQKLKSNYPADFDKVVELILNSKGRMHLDALARRWRQPLKKLTVSNTVAKNYSTTDTGQALSNLLLSEFMKRCIIHNYKLILDPLRKLKI